MVTKDVVTIDETRVKAALPTRNDDSHKWSVGGVIVVAGSPAYPGAAILASRAASRAGAGIVLLATSRGVIEAAAPAIPEVAYIPLAETESSSGARKALDIIGTHAEKAPTLVIGPGLSTDSASESLLGALLGIGVKSQTVRRGIGFDVASSMAEEHADEPVHGLLSRDGVKIVLDADGLNWLAKQEDWSATLPAQRLVLTPHPGEMARLLDRPVAEIEDDPAGVATAAAAAWDQVVVLKGARAVVSDGTTTLIADKASTALATAGSGDVLAGTIGAFAAQTGSLLDAAIISVYVGPRAAARVASRFGVPGVIAPDLPDAIAEELHDLAG